MAKTSEQALAEVQIDILTAPDLGDAERRVLLEGAVADYQKHIAGGSGERIEKVLHKNMTLHDENIIAFAKNAVEHGASPVFGKSTFLKAIERRVAQIYGVAPADGDKVYPAAFTKCITEDDIGKLLNAAMKRASGSEIEVDARQDEVEQPKPAAKGPANIEMDRLADAHLKAHPELGKDAFGRAKRDGGRAAAYTIVYSHPDNRELRDRVKAEDLGSVQRTPAGRTTVGRNPNWNADVRATMRRTSGP